MNDGLPADFFFLLRRELKREVAEGRTASLRPLCGRRWS